MQRQKIKGRGQAGRPAGRFQRRRVDPEPGETTDSVPETVLRATRIRDIVTRNQSPDIPFDRSINPYLGCEHGCAYCYARPSHSYLDLSPGIDFETQIFYKENAVDSLLATWRRPGYVVRPISIGANTDPYQPAEKRLKITRALLECFLEHRHPVSLITKGTLIRRDIDLLSALAEIGLVSVAVSIPTANDALKRTLEPRVPAAGKRFEVVGELAAAGIPVSVMMAPVIPFLNDCEIESIVRRSADAGARDLGWILLRLPHELKALFRDWLDTHYPDKASHVMSLVRQASGGRDYDNRFGIRQRGTGAYAQMIARRFDIARQQAGLGAGRPARSADCTLFRPPGDQQISLPF
ncbi:MAG: PA0069 family radical SAM protein [Woeseiaceae bacterium]|nr:PA0069 family radical SAM protein [Woeseiaceae bacterium]